MPDHHCRQCTDTAACGQYHVYVIELEDGAKIHRPFRDRDARNQANDNGVCLYVGMTAHRVSCRLGQHRAYADDLTSFPCGCFTDGEVIQRRFRGRGRGGPAGGGMGDDLVQDDAQDDDAADADAADGGATDDGATDDGAADADATAPVARTRGNRWAGTFARRLRTQLFWAHNPIATQAEALQREAALAAELRALGYRVHQG